MKNRSSHAALGALICLQLIMLFSMYAKSSPHPPLVIPFFAMGPFLAASISAAVAALVLGATTARSGTIVSVVAATLALISLGPQKWFDAAIPEIWPAVLTAQISIATLLWCAYQDRQERRAISK